MMRRYAIALGIVLSWLTLPLAAQVWGSSNDKSKVEAAPVAPVKASVGDDSTVTLNFRVRPGFHINSNTPGSDLLIPTVLKLSPPANIVVAGASYPEGKDMEFRFAPGQKLNVYSGDFELTARVMPARRTALGRYRVRGELQYQACDNRACYPPTELPVSFDVTVTSASSGRARRNPAQSPHAR